MSGGDTARTVVTAPFAGAERRFHLRIGEMGELERLTGAGIGAIYMRMGLHQFSHRDIWDTIRLGLEGGGAGTVEATALVLRYQGEPLMDHVPLAAKILAAAVNGIPPGQPEGAPGKPEAEGANADSPETSRPTTPPEP